MSTDFPPPAEPIEQRVARQGQQLQKLAGDMAASFHQLSTFQYQTERKLDARLNTIETRLGTIDARLEEMRTSMETMNTRFAEMDTKIEASLQATKQEILGAFQQLLIMIQERLPEKDK